ncbi:MAG TPA: hypothetical protein DCZ94_12855 [Lentisphaeria bacterium]|nr:MAG: hypothetical protein A2X48_10960 [Lentisphaerae bacterium GWF2_49_21]HBC87837.1 hypothetical protein [Lentisphaeria bacterium]
MPEEDKEDVNEKMARLRKIRKKAGLVVFLFFGLLFVIALSLSLILPSTEKLKGAPPNSDSAKKMYGIGYYLIFFAIKHGELYPEKLSDLHRLGLIKEFDAFDSKELPGKVTSDEDIDSGVDFKYLIAGKNVKITDEKLAVLTENKEDGITMYISKKEISFDFKRKDKPGR